MKVKFPSHLSSAHAGAALGAILLLDAALALGKLVPEELALFPATASFVQLLVPQPLLGNPMLASFVAGILASVAFLLIPAWKWQQAREARLQAEHQALKARNEALHKQAASDGLLAMANRREFERVFQLEWRRAAREQQPISLLLIDVDHFKLYNDTYGHLEGDECLRQVADVLQAAAARPGDLVARYGGEEMVIIMPCTCLEGATRMAQRVHNLLAERALAFPESPVADHLTVSIGVASTLPQHGIDRHTLIKQADEGLYLAKAKGRNRTGSVPRLRLISSGTDSAPRLAGQA